MNKMAFLSNREQQPTNRDLAKKPKTFLNFSVFFSIPLLNINTQNLQFTQSLTVSFFLSLSDTYTPISSFNVLL